jgi:multiple antibiotic resistance protein
VLAAFLLSFPALFSIVNPPSGAIIFNEVTAHQTRPQRTALARRVALYSALVMLVSLWAGTYILSFFGISLNALRIAGGLVVAVRAYEMLSAPESRDTRKAEQAKPMGEPEPQEDLSGFAFYPLTLPLTTGPGTIAVAVSLGTERPDAFSAMAGFYAGASLAVIALAILIWVSYAASDRITSVLGHAGQQIAARIAAFLLLGIGVQIMLTGIIPVLHAALGS